MTKQPSPADSLSSPPLMSRPRARPREPETKPSTGLAPEPEDVDRARTLPQLAQPIPDGPRRDRPRMARRRQRRVPQRQPRGERRRVRAARAVRRPVEVALARQLGQRRPVEEQV